MIGIGVIFVNISQKIRIRRLENYDYDKRRREKGGILMESKIEEIKNRIDSYLKAKHPGFEGKAGLGLVIDWLLQEAGF